MKIKELIFVVALLTFSCKETENRIDSKSSIEKVELEKYRPRFHFTPKENWMNDPNGLVYFNEYYHLFYQYYPDSTVWGPMHWGHAKSKDLIKWEHLPIALHPDSLGYIFSGSAVIDKENTSGFGKNAMVAMYTYHDPEKEKDGAIDFQTQGIAFSLDEGLTWTKYNGNPVINNPGIRDFRDPKVFWNDETSTWQMVLVAKDHVQIYQSLNLLNWDKLSDFRFPDDPPLGVWECPDLFKLKVENTNEEKWVMIISHGKGAPNGGSGTRYFVGDYDGKVFTTDQPEGIWIDHGTDNYAGVTYNDDPNNNRIFIGWMSNWNYAITTPTKRWRSAMTLPRKLTLHNYNDQYILKSSIVDSFDQLITQEALVSEHSIKGFSAEDLLLEATIVSINVNVEEDILIEYTNKNDEKLTIGYKKNVGMLYIDRSKSGLVNFNANFANQSYQTMHIGEFDTLSLDIILDASSLEVFVNDGMFVMTNQVFPTTPFTNLSIHEMSEGEIRNLAIKKVQNSFVKDH